MKNSIVKSVYFQSRVMVLVSLLFACLLALPASHAGVLPSCIRVTKLCNTVVVGQPNLVTAVVTNCGSIAITNISVTDNLYGSVGSIASLAPGGTATLTKSVTNTCGNFTNVVTASGVDINGTPVQAQSTATCVVTENPCIGVTKTCNTVISGSGQPNLVTAVVTNCGNVPLHGITVLDNIYGSVGTIALLAPGGTATLTKSVTNTCGVFTNVVTATGLSPCNTTVANTSTAVCVVTENPCIGVTKTCNAVVSGQPNLITAVVTNCGNVPLHGITVTDNLYGSLGTVALLAPGGTATLTRSITNTCGVFTNVVTATGLSPCNTTVANTSTAVCVVTENPCILVTKRCNVVLSGQPNLVTVVVTNCGNVPLHGITVTDNLDGSVGNIALLAPGGTATLTKSVTNTCGNFTNVVTATGLSPCNTGVTNTATATCVVRCGPQICVTKEVVCELPTGCANNWSHLATGAKTGDNSQCPSFCYRIRVTNCGDEPLNNITVVDNVLSLAACNFPTSLAPLQTVECILSGVLHCENVTNTVTATGVGAQSGIQVQTNDTAAVVVKTADLTCDVTVNGGSSVTVRCDGQAHLVDYALTICNTGELPLSGITIDAADIVALGGACTNVANLRLALLPGECTNLTLCTDIMTCQPGGCGTTSNHIGIRVTGTVDATNATACSWTRNSSNQVVAVTATSSCNVTVVVVLDTTPPRATCIPGVNPSDKKIPVAGKNPSSGQNPDGYYQLLAKDDCDPNPVIYLADTGSSFIAGPFASGDVIKLTQSPGKTPSQDPAPAPIVAHLHFKGDGMIFAVDSSGNVAEVQLCLVPRKPK